MGGFTRFPFHPGLRGPRHACDLRLTPAVFAVGAGDRVRFKLERYQTHSRCLLPLEETSIRVTGGKVVDPGVWRTGRPDVLEFTVEFTSPGAARVTVERDCAKGFITAAAGGSELLLVDIPIGLPDGSGERACDRMARRLLGPRGSSVFPAPVRAAARADSYEEACRLNEEAAGKRISRQTFAICPKIAEVDGIMAGDPRLQERIMEIHPEVCFAALNGWAPLMHEKKSPEGQVERVVLLERRLPGAGEALIKACHLYFKKYVADDDLLDALAAAVTARLAREAGMPRIPEEPVLDAMGLRMEMICPSRPAGRQLTLERRSGTDGVTLHNKLVRDRIPMIIAAQGRRCEVRTLDKAEYLVELGRKLREELAEYEESGEMAELADLVEVIQAIAAVKGSVRELERIRRAKRKERGGFEKRSFLVGVD